MDQVLFKIVGWLISIDKIILFFIGLGLLSLIFRWWKMGRNSILVGVFCLFVTSIVPTGFKMMSFLENRFPVTQIPDDAKGIILLGGSFDLALTANLGRPCYNLAAGRIIDFMVLADKHHDLPILFTGGGAAQDPVANESLNMKNILTNIKFDMSRIMFEDKSKNTHENATFSYDMVKPNPQDKWVLVTSAYHMPRAVGLFRKADWNVIPYPVDFHVESDVSWFSLNFNLGKGSLMWTYGIMEIGGMAVNYWGGKSDVWIPVP